MNNEYYFTIPGKERFDEPIVVFTHRHIVSFLGQIVLAVLLGTAPIIFISLLYQLLKNGLNDLGIAAFIVVGSIYYLILAMVVFIEWICFYYDILIVTNHTLIDIQQKNVFNRQISHVHLLQIEDISSEIKGILPTLFAYGDVIIQTAGAKERTIIKHIPNPQQTAAMILKLHKEVVETESRGEKYEA